MQPLFDLSGKTALITGSTRGLGFAYAQGLAEAGANVILNGTHEETLTPALARLQEKGIDARGFLFNVSDEKAIEKTFQQLDEEGIAVDIVINNAGIQFRQPLLDLALSDWQRAIETNLTSAFLVARATVAPYTAAKGGIKLLTKSMAAEWAQFDIQANGIGPGYILTDMNQALVENKAFNN